MFDKLRAVFQDPDVAPYETTHPPGDEIWEVPLSDLPATERARLRSLGRSDHGRNARRRRDIRSSGGAARGRGGLV